MKYVKSFKQGFAFAFDKTFPYAIVFSLGMVFGGALCEMGFINTEHDKSEEIVK